VACAARLSTSPKISSTDNSELTMLLTLCNSQPQHPLWPSSLQFPYLNLTVGAGASIENFYAGYRYQSLTTAFGKIRNS